MMKNAGLVMLLLFCSLPLAAQAKKVVAGHSSLARIEADLVARAQVTEYQASSWRITPGDWSVEMDALSLASAGTVPTSLWVTQREQNGTIVKAARISSEFLPDGRLGYVIGGPRGSVFSPMKNTYFQVAGTQLFSLSAFRGTRAQDGTIKLTETPASPLSRAASSRDERGVWFVTGDTLFDLIEMQGYNEATDRLWQGEFYKRVASGRLSEIFGSSAVGQDALVRSAGYSDAELDDYFNALDDESQTILKGYVAGFNRRIAEVNADPALLPFEYLALGMNQVEDWTYRDVMRWVSVLQRNFSGLGNLGLSQVESAVALLNFIDTYGAVDGINLFQDLRWLSDPEAPTMIPASDAAKAHAAGKTAPRISAKAASEAPDIRPWVHAMRNMMDESNEILKSLGANVKGGSYAWVLAGSKTASGNPIIYSGPQMGHESPAIVLEGSLIGADINVSGMSVIGIPGLIIGRTPHHAWSMQVGCTNTWDWYVEQEEDVSVHHMETIRVAGGEDVVIPILRSAHGPVFDQQGFLLAWKYASWGKEWELAGGNLQLARAQSMDEFGEGIAKIAVTQHFCYADRDGNIAYWMSGASPVRPPGEYRLPQGFLGPPLEWDQNILEPNVHDRNTSQGFYAGWNNRASIDDPDSSANFSYGRYHRAEVVQKYLRENDNLTYEQVKDLAVNIAATQSFGSGSGSGGGSTWPWLKDAFLAAVAADSNADRDAAVALFDGWDEHRIAGGPEAWALGQDVSEAWVLLDNWSSKVLDKTFRDELGTNTQKSFLMQLMIRELHPDSHRKNGYRRWMRNLTDASAPQSADAIIITSLDEALAELGPRPWGVGERGFLEYPHTFLGNLFPGTPWGARSTYAHCVEFDARGPVRIESVFPLGQNGTLFSDATGNPVPNPGFFSMKELYDTFTLRSFPLFNRDSDGE